MRPECSEFNEIFQRAVVVMKEKHMSLGGEEILRLEFLRNSRTWSAPAVW